MSVRVVIIGAGASGLSAAGRLHQAKFNNVTILEARNRVGGRITSLKYGDERGIEFGAQWIHGEEGNPIYQLAKENDLVDANAPRLLAKFNNFPQLTDSNEKSIACNACLYFHGEHENLYTHPDSHEIRSASSVGDYMEKKCKAYLEKHGTSSRARTIIASVFDYCQKVESHVHGSDSLYKISALLTHSYKTCKGNNNVELKCNYNRIVEALVGRFPGEWVKTDSEVISVKWDADSAEKVNETAPIEVVCKDGSVYGADHLIVTIPLGCLKARARDMFMPSLPEKKLAAIESMGFGTVNKIFLEFEEAMWSDDDHFESLWLNPEDYKDGSFTSETYMEENVTAENWHRGIFYFMSVLHQPKLLSAWVNGQSARMMETLSDEEVLESVHRLLCTVLNSSTLPKPSKIMRSGWSSDPYARGSYSYLSCECEKKGLLQADLAEPVRTSKNYPLLLFGGEATHSHFYSTVHGAYETGIREANRIVDFYSSRYSTRCGFSDKPRDEIKSSIAYRLPGTENCKIVVVGAGISGLAAAQKLTEFGFEDVTLLEAHYRLGGRVHTIPFGKGVLELGAQWVHGQEENPLYEYANLRGLLSNPKSGSSLEGSGLFCTNTGKILPNELVNEVIMFLDGIQEKIYQQKIGDSLPPCVEEMYSQQFEKYLAKPQTDQNDARRGLFDWYMRFEVIDNACHDLSTLSVEGYSEWTECNGVPLINFRAGYSSLVESLASEIPKERIILEMPVQKIYWQVENETGKPVIVKCGDGSIYQADHVIVTSSVGYLKERMVDFFEPPLPQKKCEALQHIGFGTINKIYLVYDDAFWESSDLGFQLVWLSTSPKDELLETWVRGLTGFDQVWGQPNVLVGWLGGEAATEVESIPEGEIARSCTVLLRKFLNRPDIPFPIQVLRSRWNSNPYIRGSYSHRLLGYKREMTSDITEPLYDWRQHVERQKPSVLFAGEATDQNFFSSVHGALRSGWREAERLFDFWR